MNQIAKQLYRNSNPIVPAVLRGIEIGILFLSTLFFTISLLSGVNINLIETEAFFSASSIILFMLLPLFVLVGTGILWMCAFINSAKPSNDGRILSSASVSSLTSSSIASFVCLPLTILDIMAAVAVSRRIKYLESMFSNNRYSSSNDFYGNSGYYDYRLRDELNYTKTMHGVMVVFAIILIVGMICLIITSISRKNYYTSVEKTFRGELFCCQTTGLYFVMKIINTVIRLAVLINTIILLSSSISYSDKNGSSGPSGNGLLITAMVFLFIALSVGMIGNIFEGLLVKRYGNSLADSQRRGFYGAPVQPQQVYYPEQDYQRQNNASRTEAADMYENETVFCPNCGTPGNVTSRFCSRCGNQIR